MSDEKTPNAGSDNQGDGEDNVSQDEIKARMDDIRSRMQKMRGDSDSVTAENRPATPSPKKAKKKGFSETLWFMQVEDPEHMLVDSNTDIDQTELQDKYTKKQTLEMNVRKQFSLNVDLDDFDEAAPAGDASDDEKK